VPTELYAPTGAYGFGVPIFCGPTQQDNTWEASWEVFFRDRRLGDVVRRIGERGVEDLWARMKER
jgi:fructosamine-3-kinase